MRSASKTSRKRPRGSAKKKKNTPGYLYSRASEQRNKNNPTTRHLPAPERTHKHSHPHEYQSSFLEKWRQAREFINQTQFTQSVIWCYSSTSLLRTAKISVHRASYHHSKLLLRFSCIDWSRAFRVLIEQEEGYSITQSLLRPSTLASPTQETDNFGKSDFPTSFRHISSLKVNSQDA